MALPVAITLKEDADILYQLYIYLALIEAMRLPSVRIVVSLALAMNCGNNQLSTACTKKQSQ